MLFGFNLFGLGPGELMALGVLGVLLFGRKLPEVGRYLGQSIVSFKKGMRGLEDDLEGGGNAGSATPAPAPPQPIAPPQRVAATAPKFEDVPSTPPQV